jgi:putative membrane protein
VRRAPEHERDRVGQVAAGSRLALLPAGTGALVLLFSVAPYLGDLAERYLWVHMIQHLLITLVAAPALVLGAALWLRSSDGGASLVVRRALSSHPARLLLHPVVTWVVFAAVMWVAHLSPLYQAALESTPLHVTEHLLFLGAAILFWAPLVGLGARGFPWPARIGYLVAALPQQSFLALALYSSNELLYPHYATSDWPGGPLADQRLGATVMWLGGDALLLVALVLAIAAWMRSEQRLQEEAER